jgi:hypothetical protein
MPVGKRVELMHRPLGMNPAQCMLSDIELSGIIAEHDSVAEEFMRLDAAPQSALGGDAYWIGCHVQLGEAKPVKIRHPCGLISEACPRFGPQADDQWRGQ